MVEPKPFGIVEALWSPGVRPDWQIEVLEFFANTMLHDPDPSAPVEDWFAQASQSDSISFLWALSAWKDLQDSPSLTLEMLLRECRELRRELTDLNEGRN